MTHRNPIQTPDAVISRLQEVFPNRLPLYQLTEAQLARLQGQQDVLRYLIEQNIEAQEPNDEGDSHHGEEA